MVRAIALLFFIFSSFAVHASCADNLGEFFGNHSRRSVNISATQTSPTMGSVYQLFLEVTPEDNIDEIAWLLSGNKEFDRTRDLIWQKINNGERKINLKELLPEFARKQTNSYANSGNGNCFNAVLNWHNPHYGIHQSSVKEINDALWNDFEFIHPGNELRMGDVIVFRGKQWGDDIDAIHTAIYINDDFVWHKGGQGMGRPWEFARLDQVVNTYRGLSHNTLKLEFFRPRQ